MGKRAWIADQRGIRTTSSLFIRDAFFIAIRHGVRILLPQSGEPPGLPIARRALLQSESYVGVGDDIGYL